VVTLGVISDHPVHGKVVVEVNHLLGDGAGFVAGGAGLESFAVPLDLVHVDLREEIFFLLHVRLYDYLTLWCSTWDLRVLIVVVEVSFFLHAFVILASVGGMCVSCSFIIFFDLPGLTHDLFKSSIYVGSFWESEWIVVIVDWWTRILRRSETVWRNVIILVFEVNSLLPVIHNSPLLLWRLWSNADLGFLWGVLFLFMKLLFDVVVLLFEHREHWFLNFLGLWVVKHHEFVSIRFEQGYDLVWFVVVEGDSWDFPEMANDNVTILV
jgi:hypothetical protein